MTSLFRYGLLLVALLQFFVPLLPGLGFGESIGDRATGQGIPPELPLGIFFSIWGVIFLSFLVQAIKTAVSPNAVDLKLASPLFFAGLGNCLWMYSAQTYGSVWLDFVLLIPILFCAWEAAYRLDRIGGWNGTEGRFLACLVTGLLAGWLAVAVSISVPDIGRELLGRGPTDHVWHSLWMTLIPAALLCFIFARFVSHSLWFFVAIGWGLLGIILNNWLRTETHWLAIISGFAAYLILRYRLHFGAKGSGS